MSVTEKLWFEFRRTVTAVVALWRQNLRSWLWHMLELADGSL